MSINVDFLNQALLVFKQVATQLSLQGWVDPVPDVIHFKIVEVLGIEPVTA